MQRVAKGELSQQPQANGVSLHIHPVIRSLKAELCQRRGPAPLHLHSTSTPPPSPDTTRTVHDCATSLLFRIHFTGKTRVPPSLSRGTSRFESPCTTHACSSSLSLSHTQKTCRFIVFRRSKRVKTESRGNIVFIN